MRLSTAHRMAGHEEEFFLWKPPPRGVTSVAKFSVKNYRSNLLLSANVVLDVLWSDGPMTCRAYLAVLRWRKREIGSSGVPWGRPTCSSGLMMMNLL